ncbi:Aste57867_22122 [Aphanomyces stellatus]|uniref:Aste57867_22122 protein n=1 Tax=Aphanomyces stellatus TaxID=120398 RepID=A0A485LKR0_9STRA|nr:hypothetical protein As57867_022053 [Aphanomyces stellatus]VFT98790.1 Aste57867_22122 [Aphanomyces stellatus]
MPVPGKPPPKKDPPKPKSSGAVATSGSGGGWTLGGNVGDHRIPPYDAATDKHGALAPKISPPKMSPGKKGRRPPTSSTPTSPPVHRPTSISKEDATSIVKAPAHRGNITFESESAGNGGMELDVLKAIILREDYIGRLREMAESATPYAVVGSMANTLDMLRLTTVEVVETIVTWRKQQPKHMPFKWNGVNYLLKIPSDLDFLEQCDVMVRWLGFSMLRNPFVVPDNLDAGRLQSFEPSSLLLEPFTAVGGHPVTPTVRTPPTSAQRLPLPNKGAKTAYETRVLNDEDLVPRQKPTTATPPATGPKPKATFVLPSQIGDLDVLRIREAEKLLLAEEEIFGRHKRDLYGRVVPEAVANQQAKTASIRGQQNGATNEDVKSSTQAHHMDRTAQSGVGSAPPMIPSKRNEKLTSSIKQAGMLAPPVKLAMQGQIQMPMQRSRGAKMEEDLEKTIVANRTLEQHIATLREAIAKVTSDPASPEHPDAAHPGAAAAALSDSATVAMLKRDLEAQVELFERKKREIFRKQEAMEAFKEAQKSAVENARLAEILRKKQMDEAALLAEKVKLVQIYKATYIQKIARGILARRAYKTIRIRYKIASTYIQSVVRGFIARRRVYKLFKRRQAAIKIQCLARGVFARNATRRERLAQKQRKAAIVIQKMYRGRLGRKRMKNYRALCTAKQRLVYLAEHLCTDELVAMGQMLCAYSKHPESKYTVKPSHVVLGLVRILKSACESCLCPEDHDRLAQTIHEVRWHEAGQYLRRANALLRTLHAVSTSAARVTLPLSTETLALIQAYKNDSQFTLGEFGAQGLLAKTSSTLYQWIMALATVSDVQHIFLPPKPDLQLHLAEHADEDRAESNKCELEDHHGERQFVPLSLIQDCPSRPRPLLVVLSRDVPGRAKQLLVDNLMKMFPGLFLRINTPSSIHIDVIQQTFDAGYSVLFDADIGLSMGQQRKFLGQFSIVSKALRPTPLNILIQGALTNRAGIGGVPGLLGVSAADLDLLVDKEAKYHVQLAADGLLALTDGRHFDEMVRMSRDDRPPVGLVLVMEAVLILLTPMQQYASPDCSTSTVTWRLSRRLLATPHLLAEKLQAIDLPHIPINNTMVLKAYIEHCDWPNENGTHGSLLFRLALYTHAVVKFALHIHDDGGAAPPITRTKPLPGLFSSVITVTDATEHDPYYKDISAKLACSILEDVRVYRESKKIGDRYHIVSLYRDCHRVYVSCYDPLTSMLWKTDVPETDMNSLLAPNSTEVAQNKKPPKNPKELYQRIVGYCALSKPKGRDPSKELELRPRALRLCRLVRKIHGHFATITVSEISLGHLRLDVHVHDSFSSQKLTWTLHVRDDEFQWLKMNATDPVEHTAIDHMDVQTMFHYVLDRVQIEHSKLTLPFVHHETVKPVRVREPPVDMRVRVRQHGGSGRLLLRQIVSAPHTHIKYVLTVFEMTWSGAMRLELYRPDTSNLTKLVISARERRELLLTAAAASPATTQRQSRRRRRRQSASIASPLWVHDILGRVTVSSHADALDVDRELDCTVYQLAYYPDIYSAVVPKANRSVRAVVRSQLAVRTNDDDDFGLHVVVYLPLVSHTHVLDLADAEVQSVVAMPWPCTSAAARTAAIRALLPHCVYDSDKAAVRLESPAGFVKYSSLVSPLPPADNKADEARAKTPFVDELPPRPPTPSVDMDLLANTARMLDGDVDGLVFLYDVSKTLHAGSYRCNGTLLVVAVSITAVLKPIVLPNKPGLPDIRTAVDSFDLALDVYHPGLSERCVLHIDGMSDLREVTGPDQAHLIGSTTVHEWLQHVVTCRMERTDERPFVASFVRSRMYTQYKATPINSVMDVNAHQNAHLLLDNPDARGLKITSKARHIRGRAVIFTAFDLTPPDHMDDDRALHVHVRIDGYIASTCQKLSCWVRGATLVEAIGSHVELLHAGAERALAEHLIERLDLDIGGTDAVRRLFVQEIVVTPVVAVDDTRHTTTTPRAACLFKTFRAVSGEKVLVSVLDTAAATPELPLRIQLYQPASSLTTHLDVPRDVLRTLVPTAPATWTEKSAVHATLRQLLSHVCVTRVEDECGTSLHVAWALDGATTDDV